MYAAAFAERYGGGVMPLGIFTGALDNSGEKIRLADSVNEVIHEFRYESTWYAITAGVGYSLVVNDAMAPPDSWGQSTSWRPSLENGGNPGLADNGIVPGSIRVNEILPNTAASGGSWIELANTTSGDIPIGYWYLSDSEAMRVDQRRQRVERALPPPRHRHDDRLPRRPAPRRPRTCAAGLCRCLPQRGA